MKSISIRNAHEHFLKNLNIDLPLQKLIVVTGVSGSGKSSLVVDTLYRESERRYLELLLGDQKLFFGEFPRPKVDTIEGLPPVFFAGGRGFRKNPRSTVGTMAEVQDYLRILFAEAGDFFCFKCGQLLKKYTTHEIAEEILARFPNEKIMVLAPLPKKAGLKLTLENLRKEGFVRIRVGKEILELDEIGSLPQGTCEIVVDRWRVRELDRTRLADSIEVARRYGGGVVLISGPREDFTFCTDYQCVRCSVQYGEITPAFFSFNSPYGACACCKGLGSARGKVKICSRCHGARLRESSLSVRLGSYNLHEIGELSILALMGVLRGLGFADERRSRVSSELIPKILERLRGLVDFGVSYLSLNRSIATLSRGEFQRVRLASQMASGLSRLMYVLDEPTSGLHPKEVGPMIQLLMRLRDAGNTILVVEHDESVIRNADHVLELGPGAGPEGGLVVAEGPRDEILRYPSSLTGKLLSRELSRKIVSQRKRVYPKNHVFIRGAQVHNLKKINVQMPLNVFCCITGVSGSGKSSLMYDVFYGEYQRKLRQKMVYIDPQTEIASSRANVATQIGVFDSIRRLYASVPESRVRGYRETRFSFNVKGGRCEACKGSGVQQVQLFYLPDLEVSCEVCSGARYNHETLEAKYKGQNIARTLAMTVEEAFRFFEPVPFIAGRLKGVIDLGMGYLTLGQTANSLSGGEALRVKLASSMMQRGPDVIYILDEPTRGLHLNDIEKLLDILFRLRDEGNSIFVIEHHLEVIRVADDVIDLGPGAGEEGGEVVAIGTPEEIAENPRSETGKFLKMYYQKSNIKNQDDQ